MSQESLGLKVFGPIDIDAIRKVLPHRYPFLMVDRILEIRAPEPLTTLFDKEGKVGIEVTGIKAISYGESAFQGHFPDQSIFPGVQIIESMAQVACFALYPFVQPGMPDQGKKFLTVLSGVDQVRFRKPVIPGDVLRIEAKVTRFRGTVWGFSCSGFVDGHKVAEAEILANMVNVRDEA
jgi:3-hydroxyacyl-[acyl-carrier-protein] dehydratase